MPNYRHEPVPPFAHPSINFVRNLSPPKAKPTKKRRLKSKSIARSRGSRKASLAPTASTVPTTVLHRRFPKDSNSDLSINEVLEIAEEGSSARDNIRVLVRIRPKTIKEKANKEARTIVKAIDLQTIMFDQKEDMEEFFFHGVKQKDLNFMRQRRNKDLTLGFDYVFSPMHSNVEIFDTALKNIVDHVLLGYNCSVFAYGATGSGKTFTMLGSSENPGLTFLMAKELCRKIQERSNEYESEIVVSYLEIYNEKLKDLLSPNLANLNIREDGLHGVNIPNLTKHKIQETSELLSMLSQGNSVRTQHPTDHNAESSRSHAVFQVFVELRRRITRCNNYKMQKAKLVMVDLAGSERGASNGTDNARCREGANINKSLLALGNCINALADGKKHIPYRDSNLTRLLKDSLGGNCKTVMIANVAPTILNYDDTYNTLKYADRAKEIRVKCKQNISLEPTGIAQYQKLIRDLQMELSVLRAELQKQKDINMNSKALQEMEKYNLSLDYISSNTSGFLAPVQKIHDPGAMEEFIQVIGEKKNLEEALVEASIKGKETEWLKLWKQWRIQTVGVFGKTENEPFHSSLERLRHQYENLSSKHTQARDKIQLERKLVHFNDAQIDLIRKNFLSNLKMDDPFVTITLREFLYYKGLEREVGTHKRVENHHQQMCTLIFDELVSSEYILSESFRFNQFLFRGFAENRIQAPLKDKKYRLLIATFYGDRKRQKNEATERRLRSQGFSEELIELLRQVIHNPVVEYEAPAMEDGSSEGCSRNPLEADCSAASITPMRGSEASIGASILMNVASSHSDIAARRSISDFIQKTKTAAPPSPMPQGKVPSSYRGSDSDCMSEPFSFTLASSRNYTQNTGKSISGTSIEPELQIRGHLVQSIASDSSLKVTRLMPVSLGKSNSSSSEGGLQMKLQPRSRNNFSNNSGDSEEENRIPLRRTHAGPSVSYVASPGKVSPAVIPKVQRPIRITNQRSPPPQLAKPCPRTSFYPLEKTKPRDQVPVPVPDKTSRQIQNPEPNLTSRLKHRHQAELVESNTRKRKGGKGSGDFDDNGHTVDSLPKGQEDCAIIGPPAAFADSVSGRPTTYYLRKPSLTHIPSIDSETDAGSDEVML